METKTWQLVQNGSDLVCELLPEYNNLEIYFMCIQNHSEFKAAIDLVAEIYGSDVAREVDEYFSIPF